MTILFLFVIPAKAGIQIPSANIGDVNWTPACAGVTAKSEI